MKIISSILIIAFLNLIGCYSVKTLTVPEVEKDKPTIKVFDEIRIVLRNGQEYEFKESAINKPEITVVGDSLCIVNEQNFALSDIKSIEIDSINWPIYLLVAVLLGAAILGGLIALLIALGKIEIKFPR